MNGFKATIIWPFNPEVMHDNIKTNNVYTTLHTLIKWKMW